MTIRACDVMEPNVVTVRPGTTLLEVVRLFDEMHIHGAPVVEDDEVIGVISSTDLLGLAHRLADLVAEDVMATDVISVEADTPVAEIARVMRQLSIHRVLVIDDGRLEGIVTALDLVRLIEEPDHAPRAVAGEELFTGD